MVSPYLYIYTYKSLYDFVSPYIHTHLCMNWFHHICIYTHTSRCMTWFHYIRIYVFILCIYTCIMYTYRYMYIDTYQWLYDLVSPANPFLYSRCCLLLSGHAFGVFPARAFHTCMHANAHKHTCMHANTHKHTCMHANTHKHTHTLTQTGVSDCASNPTMIKRLKEKAPLAFMLAFRDVRDFGSERFISLPFLSPSPLLFVHTAAPVAPASAGGPAAGYLSKQVATDKRPSSESRDLSVQYPVHQVSLLCFRCP